MGRPRKYTDLERKLLNKCKHKYVQDFLKENIFGKDYFTCLKYMDMVSLWIADLPKYETEEYRAIWLGIYRYVTEKFKNRNIKNWYPEMNFNNDTDGYDKDATWNYKNEYQQE